MFFGCEISTLLLITITSSLVKRCEIFNLRGFFWNMWNLFGTLKGLLKSSLKSFEIGDFTFTIKDEQNLLWFCSSYHLWWTMIKIQIHHRSVKSSLRSFVTSGNIKSFECEIFDFKGDLASRTEISHSNKISFIFDDKPQGGYKEIS